MVVDETGVDELECYPNELDVQLDVSTYRPVYENYVWGGVFGLCKHETYALLNRQLDHVLDDLQGYTVIIFEPP